MLQTRETPKPEALRLAPGVDLALARAHEAAGASRHLFALLVGATLQGPILWFHPAWSRTRLHADGVRDHLEPGRLVFGAGRSDADLLWAAEEALRAGLAPLVVIEATTPPGLTAVRRLHLAAREGADRRAAPLCLILTPGAGGTPGIETRWRLNPAPGLAVDEAPRWRLARLRARAAPEHIWEMRLGASGRIALAASAACEPAGG